MLAALPLLFLPARAGGTDLLPGDVLGRPAPVAVAELPPALRQLDFVENLGQWNTPASFVAALGRTVVRAREASFVVDACPGSDGEWVQLRFEFEGARSGVEPVGAAPLPGLRNYLRGSDPERWVHGARAFGQVVYAGLYEGIDLRLRDADGMPEYDLLLAPDADLSQVVLRCGGVSGLEVDEQGGLLMHSAKGVLRQSPPVTWCVLPSGEKEPLQCEFVVLDEARFGFRLAEHAADLPVVVDPGLEWATYLGGDGNEYILGMDRNSSGQIVVAGSTLSIDFPTTLGPPDLIGYDAFVSILDATGSTLVASTLLGGAGEDLAFDVQVGAGDKVFVVGTTNSVDFPVTPSTAYRPTPQGKYDGFVAQLNSDLSLIDYASYIGGSEFDAVGALKIRAPGILTIAGATRSADFKPVTSATAVQPSIAGGSDYFICRIDLSQPPASQPLYGTYLGGSADEGKTSGTPIGLSDPQIHEAASGVVTLAGRTKSADIVRTAVGYDTSFNSTSSADEDGYLASVDPSQSGALGLVYDSYLGGDLRDAARSLAVDSAGVITVGGFSDSANLPTTPGAFRTELIGPFPRHDGFISRLDPSQPPAQQLLYSTFLAGDGYENVTDLVLDSSGRVIAQGYSGATGLVSNRFPTTCGAFQPFYAGNNDGFLVWLDPAGNGASDLLYSTFLGGIGWDLRTFGLELLTESPTLRFVSAGGTGELGFPWSFMGAAQPIQGGLHDGLVLQFEIDPNDSCVNPVSYCTSGTSASGCTATLSGAGNASASAPTGFVLTASGGEGAKDGLYFFGTNGRQANTWGNGTSYQCVGPPVKRAGLLMGTGTVGSCDGAFSQDLNARWTAKPAQNPGAGAVVQAQLWYRDPFNTSNQTTSLSDAIEFTVAP